MTDPARPSDWDVPVEIPEVDTSLDRIVVPFDGSKAAERALGYAAAFAVYSAGEIVVVVAYDPPITVRRRGGITLDSLRTEMEEEANELATESATVLAGRGLQARAIVVRGDVADAILDTVDQEDANLIVIGRSGLTSEVKGGERRDWGSGSITDKIVRNANDPGDGGGLMLTRREFVRQSAATVTLLAVPGILAACGDPRAADRLSFLNWQDYIDQSLLGDFTTRSGIEVTYETYESNDELARRLAQAQRVREGGRSGTSFDLMVPSDNFVARFRTSGSLTELDPGQIPNLANLDDVFRRAEFDPGNRFSVPWATGTTGIGYDSTAFDEPPGYTVFVEPALSGQASILNETRDAFALALFDLGLDPNTVDPGEIDAAADRLIEMKEAGTALDSSTYLDRLVSGELVVAQAYSSDLLQARESNPDLAFVLPESGALRWVDSMAIPSEAPRPANSMKFIDFYLEAEISAANSVVVRVDTGNQAAREFLPEEFLADPVIFPPEEVLERLAFTADLGESEDLYDEAWERVQGA